MSWTYTPIDHNSVGDVIREMTGTLNGHHGLVRAGAKIGLSDQSGGKARGVIFVNGDLDHVPSVPTGGWQPKVFTTSDDYKRDLYLPAADFLNQLEYDAAYWAKSTFTNFEGGSATLEIWFPTS